MTIQIDLQEAEELAAKGLTKAQIAHALGISERTLYKQQAENAEFADAIKKGQAKGIKQIANALFDAAINGNVTAMIFFLKFRGGWKEAKEAEKVLPSDLDEMLADLNI